MEELAFTESGTEQLGNEIVASSQTKVEQLYLIDIARILRHLPLDLRFKIIR